MSAKEALLAEVEHLPIPHLIALLAQQLQHARAFVPPPDDTGEFRQDDVDLALAQAEAFFAWERGRQVLAYPDLETWEFCVAFGLAARWPCLRRLVGTYFPQATAAGCRLMTAFGETVLLVEVTTPGESQDLTDRREALTAAWRALTPPTVGARVLFVILHANSPND